MNTFVLYISLILAFIQGGLFNSIELNKESNFKVIKQIISQKSTTSHNDFQSSIFIIDEENDDDDDFSFQKRKSCLSIFENYFKTIYNNPSKLSLFNKDFVSKFANLSVLFHILHSNFRV